MIFYNGLHLEAKMADVLERIGERRSTQAVTDPIPRSRLLSPAQFQGQYDPHVWFDVRLWMLAVGQVRDTLARLDPGSAELYWRNAAAYLEELEELDAYVRGQAKRTAEHRVIVTAPMRSTTSAGPTASRCAACRGSRPPPRRGQGNVQELADFIAEREIPAIFVESSVSPRTVEAVREAVRPAGSTSRSAARSSRRDG